LGLAFFTLRQYSQALPLLRETVSRAPKLRAAHTWLAATLGQLGQLDEARAAAAEVLRITPDWTINGIARRLAVFKNSHDAEHYFEGLRKAGLPED
jgi:Flp pilus assembly protein TadD